MQQFGVRSTYFWKRKAPILGKISNDRNVRSQIFFFKFLQVTISEPFFEYLYVEFITYFFHLSVISICRCQFPSGALTGNLNVDHAMCVLSLNIINDKIFLLEWLWFYVLALASSFSLISSAILVILPPSRKLWIR